MLETEKMTGLKGQMQCAESSRKGPQGMDCGATQSVSKLYATGVGGQNENQTDT
jgi:hypothetical protein